MPEPFEVSVWSPIGREEIKIPHPELERLACAACINARFGKLFLDNPLEAADAGYQGRPFLLNSDERAFLRNLKAPTMQMLARQIAMWISGNVDQIFEISLEESTISPQAYTLPDSANEKALLVKNSGNASGNFSPSQPQSQHDVDRHESPRILLPAKATKLRSHSLVFVWSQT